MKIVDKKRAEYGLKSMADLRAAGELKDILTQQKEETVAALSVVARPVEVRIPTACLRDGVVDKNELGRRVCSKAPGPGIFSFHFPKCV